MAFAVQTVNRDTESRMTIACPLDHVVLSLPEEPVLWTEKRSQPKELAAEFLENLRGMSEAR